MEELAAIEVSTYDAETLTKQLYTPVSTVLRGLNCTVIWLTPEERLEICLPGPALKELKMTGVSTCGMS